MSSPRPSRKKRAGRALLLFALFVPVGLAVASGFPLCPTAGMFGIPCPGCGLTRAVLAAVQGNFSGAFHYHPLFFVLGPIYFGALAAAVLALLQGPHAVRRAPNARRRIGDRTVTAGALVLFVAMIGVWGLRFAGWFGGPVPVTTFAEWSRAELRVAAATAPP